MKRALDAFDVADETCRDLTYRRRSMSQPASFVVQTRFAVATHPWYSVAADFVLFRDLFAGPLP